MSKGIIILNEIPEKCDQCLVRHPGLAYCQITQKSTSHSSTGKPLNEKKRPDWCPVRPLPDEIDMGSMEDEEKSETVQPDLPLMKNNDQRKEWLRNYRAWGLWYEDEHIGAQYYKYDFENGTRLIAETYMAPATKYIPEHESCYFHLVGGPEPVKKNGVPKWERHEVYSRYPDSETELVEFLKETQKKGGIE